MNTSVSLQLLSKRRARDMQDHLLSELHRFRQQLSLVWCNSDIKSTGQGSPTASTAGFCRLIVYRNTVFNASAQSGLYYVPRLTAAGFGTFRIELVNEQPEVIRDLSQRYRDVLDGNVPPGHAWEWLTAESKGGVSAGSLEVKKERAVSSLRPTARRV